MAITRVSTAPDGTQSEGDSFVSSLSGDGNLIAFQSSGVGYVPGDTNGFVDVFAKNLTTGAVTRLSTAADGTQANGVSILPRLSSDGTLAAFTSAASNLVDGDTNGSRDVFVKNLATGAITRVSTAADGTQGNADSGNSSQRSAAPDFSADGSRVAFFSSANNLVAGDTNGFDDVFVKDLNTGAITRASTATDGTQANNSSQEATLSADGTRVAFYSSATNLVAGDTNSANDVFVKNLTTGEITRASTAADGTQGNNSSATATLSADGNRVAFGSSASNLVTDDTNAVEDIFVKDLTTGAITRVSTAAGGAQANGSSFDARISEDGNRVIFNSNATNLVDGDTNGRTDTFVKDLRTGEINRLSVANDGTQGDGNSFAESLSADGSRASLFSFASNLVPGDTNGRADVFVVDVPCYAIGTRILTVSGEAAVEDLSVGDLVVTSSGAHRPIRWLGHRSLDCSRHLRPEAVWPVRVLAGAFGEGLPRRDLWLSPDHAVRVSVLDEVLIPVKHLINDATIAQVQTDAVTYWHVELDSHDILLAEGLPAESFLDTGVRAGFENAGEHMVLHPDFAPLTLDDFCLPLVQDGPIVDAVRTRLLARAAAMGWSLTADDGMHILADGIVIEPERDGAVARFTIPAETVEARLISRSFVPERVRVGAGDGRRLGVPVRALSVVDGSGVVRSLPIDHPLLSDGYSFVQTHEGDAWRWTDGDARIPAALWTGVTTDMTLCIETAPDLGMVQAWMAPEAPSNNCETYELDRQAA